MTPHSPPRERTPPPKRDERPQEARFTEKRIAKQTIQGDEEPSATFRIPRF